METTSMVVGRRCLKEYFRAQLGCIHAQLQTQQAPESDTYQVSQPEPMSSFGSSSEADAFKTSSVVAIRPIPRDPAKHKDDENPKPLQGRGARTSTRHKGVMDRFRPGSFKVKFVPPPKRQKKDAIDPDCWPIGQPLARKPPYKVSIEPTPSPCAIKNVREYMMKVSEKFDITLYDVPQVVIVDIPEDAECFYQVRRIRKYIPSIPSHFKSSSLDFPRCFGTICVVTEDASYFWECQEWKYLIAEMLVPLAMTGLFGSYMLRGQSRFTPNPGELATVLLWMVLNSGRDDWHVADFLLEKWSANPNATCNGEPILIRALVSGKLRIAKTLIKHKAEVNPVFNGRNATCMAAAA
ncbi:hypothetical protein T484DRAFT_1758359, partial [Baffinella frigidus]